VNASLWTSISNAGFTALSIGTASGLQFTSANSAARIQAVVTYPPVDIVTWTSIILSGTVLGVVKYDVTAGVFTNHPGVTNTSNNAPIVITAPWPSTGVYLTAGIKQNIVVSTSVLTQGTAWVAAWANQSYAWSVNQAQDLWIQFNSSSQTTITVTPTANVTYPPPSNYKPLSVWFYVQLGSQVSHQSTIKYQYTAAQVQAAYGANFDASKLRLAWYDTSKNQWTFPSSGASVDTTNMLIIQQTTSFSQWGVYASTGGSSGSGAKALSLEMIPLVALAALALSLLM